MKTCQRCKIEQDLDQFTKKTNTCKSCFKIYNKEYYKNNKHRYANTNKDKVYHRNYYYKNREKILNRSKQHKYRRKLTEKALLSRLKQFRRILNISIKKDFEIYTSNEIWATETEYLHFNLKNFPIFQKSV